MKAEASSVKIFTSHEPFVLQSGEVLPSIRLAYSVYGRPDQPVMWVFHALTGSSRIEDWWAQALAPHGPLDPDRWCIVCANMPGSCYGSSGPAEALPGEAQPRWWNFPQLSIRDQVRAYDLLREHLGIASIEVGVGSSMGGQQAIEWAAWQPSLFEKLVLIATNAEHSPWGRAFNAAQRLAIETELSFGQPGPEAGKRGMAAARAIGMLSYRSYDDLRRKSGQALPGQTEESYLRHMGHKLSERFVPASYHLLTRVMDSHAVGRADGLSTEQALEQIRSRALVVSIDSDLLFPPAEQVFIASHIPGATHTCIRSPFGHDAFLIEFRQLNQILKEFLS